MTPGPSWGQIGRVAREARDHDLAIVAQAAAADRVVARDDENARPLRPASGAIGGWAPGERDAWAQRIAALETRASTLIALFTWCPDVAARRLDPSPVDTAERNARHRLDERLVDAAERAARREARGAAA